MWIILQRREAPINDPDIDKIDAAAGMTFAVQRGGSVRRRHGSSGSSHCVGDFFDESIAKFTRSHAKTTSRRHWIIPSSSCCKSKNDLVVAWCMALLSLADAGYKRTHKTFRVGISRSQTFVKSGKQIYRKKRQSQQRSTSCRRNGE